MVHGPRSVVRCRKGAGAILDFGFWIALSLAPTACCLLLTAYCLLLTAYCLLPTAYCLLPTAYCLLLTAYCLLLSFLAAASAARVEPMVISRDSLGMLVTKGVISQPNPAGISRVREIDSHST